MSSTTSTPAAQVTPPPPAVQSNGSYTGQCIGANVVLLADIGFQQLCNDLEITYAQMATTLANDETAIQDQLSSLQQDYWNEDNMTQVENDIAKGGSLPSQDSSYLSAYSTALGAAQAAVQAGTKGIDPVLTPTQNMPQALVTSANEEIQEAGSVIQGISFLANLRIQ